MIYINKTQANELTLNIVNNISYFYVNYTFVFSHIMSAEVKSYILQPTFENNRYATFNLDLSAAGADLPYEGQYKLQIFGNGTDMVYTNFSYVEGTQESNPFFEYISPNETMESYIYINDEGFNQGTQH